MTPHSSAYGKPPQATATGGPGPAGIAPANRQQSITPAQQNITGMGPPSNGHTPAPNPASHGPGSGPGPVPVPGPGAGAGAGPGPGPGVNPTVNTSISQGPPSLNPDQMAAAAATTAAAVSGTGTGNDNGSNGNDTNSSNAAPTPSQQQQQQPSNGLLPPASTQTPMPTNDPPMSELDLVCGMPHSFPIPEHTFYYSFDWLLTFFRQFNNVDITDENFDFDRFIEIGPPFLT